MRGKRAKAERGASRPATTFERRTTLLNGAALALAEAVIARNRTGEFSIAQESHDLASLLVRQAAAISGRLDDAWAQAWLMAEDGAPSIEAQLPLDVESSGVRLRDGLTWPSQLTNKPMHPFSGAAHNDGHARLGQSGVEKRAIHQIAHAIAAVWMTSEPVSVGFSAYSTPRTIGDQALGVVAAAGDAAEKEFEIDRGAPYREECECHAIALLAAVSQLEVGPAAMQHETAREWLQRIGRWEDVTLVWDSNYAAARLLVARSRRKGHFGRLVGDLITAGRVEIAPPDIPLIGEKDRFLTVGSSIRERAFAAAAGCLVEAVTCKAPILVAPGYWGCEWFSEVHEASAPVGGIAAFLAVKALNDPTLLDARGVELPADSSTYDIDAARRGFKIVRHEWHRIESIAEAAVAEGWVIVVNGNRITPEVSSLSTVTSMPMMRILMSRTDDDEGTGEGAGVATTQ